jgi:hypothetical protein
MKVAVFDTYVRKQDGSTLHFDIIVPDQTSPDQTIAFGKKYLNTQIQAGDISTRECQFCHIEEPSTEMISSIKSQGFFILEFEDIPAELPENPTRRQLIEHIRANSEKHRFDNFQGIAQEELLAIIQKL